MLFTSNFYRSVHWSLKICTSCDDFIRVGLSYVGLLKIHFLTFLKTPAMTKKAQNPRIYMFLQSWKQLSICQYNTAGRLPTSEKEM